MRTISLHTANGIRMIGDGQPCFIIAEMSANHQQNFDTAVEIIKAAAAAGADAIKLQTYTADTITFNSKKKWFMEYSEDNPDNWKGQSLYELYQAAYTPWEWHAPLQKVAEDLGLVFFSTAYDASSVDFLETLNVPCYKIASYEATQIPLLKKVAATKKPIIMSVGYATRDEIDYSVAVLRECGVHDLALLHCITEYASTPDPTHANLRTIADIRERYDVVAGFSENNGGIETAVTAAALGASILERHFILDKNVGGYDAQFSLGVDEFKIMVDRIRRAEQSLGIVHYGPQSDIEAKNLRYRQSLFVVADMKKGDRFNLTNVRCIRPAYGLETRYYDDVLGKTAANDIEAGTPLSWDMIQK